MSSEGSQPFDAPLVDADPPWFTGVVVLGAWALAVATIGSAAGSAAQVLRGWEGAGAALGLGGLSLGAVVGLAVLTLERRASLSRPELLDARGGRSRPLHGAVLAIPAGLAMPGLFALGAVAAGALQSPAAGAAFVGAALVVGWGGLRAIARHRVSRALEALELGRPEDAVQRLHALARSWWVGRSVRAAARLNLAMLAVNAGNGQEALEWVAPIRGGSARAWAATTRALALLLRGDPPEDAEEALAEAGRAPGARAVQPEADAVRVLAVWRARGPTAARELAEGLHGPTATALHRALLAELRERSGDPAGADELRGRDVDQLLGSGLGQAIPELR